MLTVGSSTFRGGSEDIFSGEHKVSEMKSFSIPETQTISPASASDTSILSRPL